MVRFYNVVKYPFFRIIDYLSLIHLPCFIYNIPISNYNELSLKVCMLSNFYQIFYQKRTTSDKFIKKIIYGYDFYWFASQLHN